MTTETLVLRGARVLREGGFSQADVQIRGGRITAIGENLPGDVRQVSGDLVPGLIDEHIHGIAGHDTMRGAQDVFAMSEALARHGVTTFLPTTMNAGVEETRAALLGVREVMRAGAPGAAIAGAHMEGPFLGAAYPGAQKAGENLPPTAENFARLTEGASEIVRLLTLAPENPGALALIAHLSSRGIVVSAGHTDATYEQIEQAAEYGLAQMTHLYNCMSPLHHRAPGAVGAALTLDSLSAQVIADGIHLHPAAVKLAVRACHRVLLITDAMEAADMPDGDYDLGGQRVFVREGAARLAAGNLAGSTLTLERGVRNAMCFAGISLERAVGMASWCVADSLGLTDRGRIRPGLRADLCLLDEAGRVRMTMVEGRIVYEER
ncbi:MAG: N-acetylglucosamine-6-phosphate deacetylase [Candidatus Spyradocola sp.]